MTGSVAPTLARLLSPTTVDEFAQRFWERRWLHLSDGARERCHGLLDMADLDRLVAFHRHPTIPPFSLAENGPVRAQAMTSGVRDAAEALRGGQTIFVGSLHERWLPAARLCRALASELRHPVGCTLVVSPPGAQGLEAHFDAADVFVLQLAGRKVWKVAEPDRPLPLVGDPLTLAGGLPDSAVDVALSEGDLFYVPRGFPHLAFTPDDSYSVHLSVYVDVLRWRDAVARVLEHAAQRSVELRRALPLGALHGPRAADLASELRARVEELVALLDAPGTLQAMAEEFVRELAPLPEGEIARAAAAQHITPDSTVARRDGALCEVSETMAGATIHFPGASVSGPPHIAPALHHIAEHRQFRVSELPGAVSDNGRVVLVRRLVRDGLLAVTEEDQPGNGRTARSAGGQQQEVRL